MHACSVRYWPANDALRIVGLSNNYDNKKYAFNKYMQRLKFFGTEQDVLERVENSFNADFQPCRERQQKSASKQLWLVLGYHFCFNTLKRAVNQFNANPEWQHLLREVAYQFPNTFE